MDDARALVRDVALLAGTFGNAMEMNILPGMTAQNSEGLAFMLGVAGSDPQQETAMVQMLVEMHGVLVTDEAGERGSDQAARAAAIAAAAKTPSSVPPEAATARLPTIAGT